MTPSSVTFDDGVLLPVRAPTAGHLDAYHVFWIPNSGSGVSAQVGNELRPEDWPKLRYQFEAGERPEKTLAGRLKAAENALQAVIDFLEESETGIPLSETEGMWSKVNDLQRRQAGTGTA